MGNCLEMPPRGLGGERYAKKRAVWAEEEAVAAGKEGEEEEEETCKGGSGPQPAPATDQVKIRITRRHLEMLLRRVNDGKRDGVTVRGVISELLCGSNVRQGQWRPALQSIPE